MEVVSGLRKKKKVSKKFNPSCFQCRTCEFVTHASLESDGRVQCYALMCNFPVVSKAPKPAKTVAASLNPQFKLSAPPLKSASARKPSDLKKPPTEMVAPLSLLLPTKK